MAGETYQVNPTGVDGQNQFGGYNVGNTTMAKAVGGGTFQASYNTGFGRYNLYSITTGYQNTAFGINVLSLGTAINNNVGVGSSVLTFTSGTANGNTGVGASVLYANTGGNHNTAIGLQSMFHNTTGQHNTSIGRDSGFSNTTGEWNTNLGVDANPGCTTGSRNTSVGGEAGYTEDLTNQNVTGSFNTWVGSQSGPISATQLDYAIGIGYRAKNDKSHQVVLGGEDITETVLRGTVIIDGTPITGAQVAALLAMLSA